MNISLMHPYSNKPVDPVNAVKTGGTQPYVQQKNQNSDSDFLNIFNNALKNIQTNNTTTYFNNILSEKISNIAHGNNIANKTKENTVQENFFSLLNNAYHSLLGVNTHSISGLPSNFSGYFTKRVDKENNNTLFDKITTISGDTKKAHKAYSASAVLETMEDKKNF